MKLFIDMAPVEKINHIEACLQVSLADVRDVTEVADILDVWDYWAPYMIKRLRKLEAVAEAAKVVLEDEFGDMEDSGPVDCAFVALGLQPLKKVLAALEAGECT